MTSKNQYNQWKAFRRLGRWLFLQRNSELAESWPFTSHDEEAIDDLISRILNGSPHTATEGEANGKIVFHNASDADNQAMKETDHIDHTAVMAGLRAPPFFELKAKEEDVSLFETLKSKTSTTKQEWVRNLNRVVFLN